MGTNDLENKHYLQVLDELKQVLDDVRYRFPGVKLIVSELLPRNDTKDGEVKCFNTVLKSYAEQHTDITIATHHNMRDPQFTMFYDKKHIRENNVPRFAKNLIRAMLSAYKIQSKSELYPTKTMHENDRQKNKTLWQKPPDLMRTNLMSLAGYGQTGERSGWNEMTHQKNNNININNNNRNFNNNNNSISNNREGLINDIMQKLANYMKSCI